MIKNGKVTKEKRLIFVFKQQQKTNCHEAKKIGEEKRD